MRVFQNIGLYAAYVAQIEHLWQGLPTFSAKIQALVDDRFGGVHYLKPVIERDPSLFFVAGDSVSLQKLWSKEMGMRSDASLEEILLAQIEHHRTDIFYNLDPVRYDNKFLTRIPGCVKKTIAWRAAPSGNANFLNHDLIVNNYPHLSAQYRAMGAKTAYFHPGHDPAMDQFGGNSERPIDVLFIGGYSRHHLERASTLEAVSRLAHRHKVVFNLDVSRATQLAETPLGWFGPLTKLRRPKSIRQITHAPVFGLDMYRQISRAKIVINGKVDIAGPDRGNMRVWEALGCGAMLITDPGRYPDKMAPNTDFVIAGNTLEISDKIEKLLECHIQRQEITRAGSKMIREKFSKSVQWKLFQELCS